MPANSADSEVLEISVRAAADLFTAPSGPDAWSPLAAEALGISALEHALGSWMAHHARPPRRIGVRFLAPPTDEAEAKRRATLPETFAAHLRLRIAQTEERHARLRRSRRYATWLGLGVLVLGNVLARMIEAGYLPVPFPGLLEEPLVEALSIIGWVALWVPFEAWLISPFELRRERRLLQHCAAAPLEIG
jgi:hypothetical protein